MKVRRKPVAYCVLILVLVLSVFVGSTTNPSWMGLNAGDSTDLACGESYLKDSQLCKDTKGKHVASIIDGDTSAYLVLDTDKTAYLGGSTTMIRPSNMDQWKMGWSIRVPEMLNIQLLKYSYSMQSRNSSNDNIQVIGAYYYDQNGDQISDFELSDATSKKTSANLIRYGVGNTLKLSFKAFQKVTKLYKVVYFKEGHASHRIDFHESTQYYIMPAINVVHF